MSDSRGHSKGKTPWGLIIIAVLLVGVLCWWVFGRGNADSVAPVDAQPVPAASAMPDAAMKKMPA